MIYHLKKDSRWRIPLILILALYLIVSVNALTIDETAAYYHSFQERDGDRLFVGYVNSLITTSMIYSHSTDDWNTWNVNSTNITWRERIGDCSEFALLSQQMISPYLKSHLVYGYYNGILHDTVKVYLEDERKWVYVDMWDRDAVDMPFVELGEGLHPQERIVYATLEPTAFGR